MNSVRLYVGGLASSRPGRSVATAARGRARRAALKQRHLLALQALYFLYPIHLGMSLNQNSTSVKAFEKECAQVTKSLEFTWRYNLNFYITKHHSLFLGKMQHEVNMHHTLHFSFKYLNTLLYESHKPGKATTLSLCNPRYPSLRDLFPDSLCVLWGCNRRLGCTLHSYAHTVHHQPTPAVWTKRPLAA